MTAGVDSRKRSLVLDSTTFSSPARRRPTQSTHSQADAFLSVLASAACSLRAPGVPVISCDSRSVIVHLEERFKLDAELVGRFLECFQAFIANEDNLRRILLPMTVSGRNGSVRSCDSLARVLLSVAPIQTSVATGLLEKLPEYVGDVEGGSGGPLPPLMESIPRLILSHFRWLDYVVDSRNLTEKLLEIITICPVGLKKEIISFLPEVIVDADHEMVVQALEGMLQEDLQLVVPILDAFSSFNLEEKLFEQVVALALSSLRSADAEDLPLVVKFLLQSATSANVTEIVQQLRENLQFVTTMDVRMSKPDRKQKGKSPTKNCEALVLEAIRSGLRFQNVVLEGFLKEIRNVEGEKNHRVVDIWLLLIIHVNGGPYRKIAEQLLFKKICRGDIGRPLLLQCIQGRGDSLQEYFQTLISVSESCLRSTETVARRFGMQIHELLFEEFIDPYHRQEVLGSLITLTGSGISNEVGSALDTLLLLATRHVNDLLPISSFINGVLDSLEGFEDKHLHQVYKIFSHLAVAAWSAGGSSNGSSVASELLIIVRKQISSPDPKYKRMGIIGAVGLASCLCREDNLETETEEMNHQRSSTDEAIFLLQMILETCKSSSLARGFFYDELTAQAETTSLNGPIMNWISKHTNEFETLFLGDLENGQLQTGSLHNGALEGEIWMNLDGEVSPIILNILPMLIASDKSLSQALLFLTANFRLLSAVERVINQGSLGSIDALLGCPMYLPKYQLLTGDAWERLPKHQKEEACLALFYAINWTRELINAFSTQIDGRFEDLATQTTREETVSKLCKRVRNLMFLEFCLGECLTTFKVSLPSLHSMIENPSQSKADRRPASGKQEAKKSTGKRGRPKKLSKTSEESGSQKGVQNTLPEIGSRQQTIRDAFNKVLGSSNSKSAGAEPEEQEAQPSQSVCNVIDMSINRALSGESLEEQRWKFRPLNISSMALLSVQVPHQPCCPDSAAMLPVYLYLLHDLQLKLDSCLEAPVRKLAPWLHASAVPKAPSGVIGMSGMSALKQLAGTFKSLRKHLDCSNTVLQTEIDASVEENEGGHCSKHWQQESVAACNPPEEKFDVQMKEAAKSVFLVTIRCLEKVLAYSELTMPANFPTLKDFLLAFGSTQPVAPNMASSIAPGSMEEAFYQAYTYLDGLTETAIATSIIAATETVMMLKAVVSCAQTFTERSIDDPRRRRSNSFRTSEILPYLRGRLSSSAGNVLRSDWDSDEWKKTKGDMMQQLLRMQIQNCEHPIDYLEELACTAMPQVSSKKGKSNLGVEGYPALSPATFTIWYRVLHEEVLSSLNKAIKDIQAKCKSKVTLVKDVVTKALAEVQQCISVHVVLVNLTKTHDKAPVHAMAVKCGGKFVDTFLKGMDFFKIHYEDHKENINYLVRDLQRATRIIQTLCSDAKGQKRMPVTCRVPLVKRSMERYLFCVKALLHGTSHGDSFWMGNLKHKNLHGHEVSSQLYADDVEEDVEEEQEGSEPELEDDNGQLSDAELG
ncbi:fanconi anemia group D2 protein [Marchantia polymorpha subsp. ruderalis]